MAALFLLMIVPTGGWYFLGEFTSSDRWDSLPPADQAALQDAQREVRFKLALTLVASIIMLAGTVLYVRRTVVDPLDRLARRARTVGKDAWASPREVERPDEIGDLARALDKGVRALESRAEEASRFATNLSHELRTPLAAIRGAAEILTDATLVPEERERFVQNIVSESARLERLVLGILDLARAERGVDEAAGQSVDVGAVAARAVDSCGPLLACKSLRVEVRMPDVAAVAIGDDDRLHRVLLGLLENAIRFSPQSGAIAVEIAVAGGEVLLSVADQGLGVPPELRAAVFERQFTAERDGVGAARGTGFGLSIVRSLVAASRGRVWVEDAPGGGTRFVVAVRRAG
jgi:two-component system, OmpR family, sensor histidine kinase CreC